MKFTKVASGQSIRLNDPTQRALGGCLAEDTEGQDTGAEASGAGVDPAAVALALNGASREEADAFLKKQGSLVDIQKQHLHVQLRQVHLSIWKEYLGVLLRIATALVGVAIAAGLVLMIWDASQSSGVLIEPFSVPPDLAQRGITGTVVAAKMLDHLSEMQAQTDATRPAKTYANNWGEQGIKLEIPETGVSLSELDDFLHEKLGHDTHIAGEIVRTSSGLSLTARAGGDGAESLIGSEADLDGLVQRSSESIYRLTQPFRYGMYLAEHDRFAEAISILKAQSQSGSTPLDRDYSYGFLGTLLGENEGIDVELRVEQQALAAEPDNLLAQMWEGFAERNKSLPEQAIHDFKRSLLLASSNRLQMYPADQLPSEKSLIQAYIDQLLGDFRGAERGEMVFVQTGGASSPTVLARLAGAEANEHNLAAARVTLGDIATQRYDYQPGNTAINNIRARVQIDNDAQNWARVLSDVDAIAPMLQKYPGLRSELPTMTIPLTAYAEARLGKIPDAEAHISTTPADCYDCLIARARIAEIGGQHARADWWFARAIAGQQSIPFAYFYWGQALLERGDLDGAISKFTVANQNGPKFADPLEMWGEALMAKNQSHLALEKFVEAEKYAPNWGRLHLKWGEALGYVGKNDEARAQYQKASTLDLTAADKAELAKVSHG